MKIAIEAPHGWVSSNPVQIVEILQGIASAEGRDPALFFDTVEKAAKKKAHKHLAEKSKFRVLDESVVEARRLYDTAMTVALGEITDLLSEHLITVDRKAFRALLKP